jgi:hypothetical protein
LVQFIAIPARVKRAITGIFYRCFLKRNIARMQRPVSPKVSTLKVENVRVIISRGLVSGD